MLWQTVLNAADKSTASPIVRSGDFLWLNCSRALVVYWSGLKPCWSGAGLKYLLIVGRIIDFSTFVAGQKCEIDGYKVPMEVSLPGFGIGMINDDFHIVEIWHVVTKRLKSVVMFSIALGPRCFKWRMPSLTGPNDLQYLHPLIALITRSAVNVCAISKDFISVSLVDNRVSPEEVCLPRVTSWTVGWTGWQAAWTMRTSFHWRQWLRSRSHVLLCHQFL